MTNPENIIPPVKGEIRNPKGRGKGVKNRSTILKKWLEVVTKIKNEETNEETLGTVEDKVNIALISQALKGDVQAIKEINDTLYGKITDKTELKTQGDIVINLKKGGKG